MNKVDLGITFVTDIRFPAQGVRDLAVYLALDKDKHVHLMEARRVFCLSPTCPLEATR